MSNIDIDIVSDGHSRDIAILSVRAMIADEIVAINIPDMIQKINARLRVSDQIQRLRIWGHGAPGLVCVGNVPASLSLDSTDDILERNTLKTVRVVERLAYTRSGQRREFPLLNENLLVQLQPKFAQEGWAEIHACYVADDEKGEQLLQALARVWQRRVAGGTGLQVAGGGLENTVVVARPGGGPVTRRVPPPPERGWFDDCSAW